MRFLRNRQARAAVATSPFTNALHYPFAEAPAWMRLVGLPRSSDGVHVDDAVLDVGFGPWRVTTPLHNIASAAVAGPYRAWKVLGARLSLADRGLTFGTDTHSGACLTFHEPVPGIEPTGLLRHPSLTVTVEQPHLLVRHLRQIIDA
jgi:hypothetical protein